MKILFLLPDFPYPVSTGGRMKVFNILKQLSKIHQCDILCFGNLERSNVDGLVASMLNVQVLGVIPPVSGVEKWMRIFWNLARGLPPSFASYSGRKFASALKKCLTNGNYDLVHYDIINMAQYLPYASEIPSMHSPNDATSLIYFRMAKSMPWSLGKIQLLISAVLLRRFERKFYPLFNKIHVVSEHDAVYLKKLGSNINVVTVPIAIDDAILNKADFQDGKFNGSENDYKIICTGNLGNPAIAKGVQDFVSIAWPIILKGVSNVRFIVLGQNVSRALENCLLTTTNIELVTWVEDYKGFLAGADAILVPDIAGPSGAKTRTIQAMGLGLPVVGTETAFAGIPFLNGRDGLLYKTMPECAELVLTLLNNKKVSEEMGKNAHQLIVDEFSLSFVGPRYEKLYRNAIAKFNLHRNDRDVAFEDNAHTEAVAQVKKGVQ
jgi:glycosyltransferase involved in cell wall biosynthesis